MNQFYAVQVIGCLVAAWGGLVRDSGVVCAGFVLIVGYAIVKELRALREQR